MSGLGHLERLLDATAVEWVQLGSVCKVFNGFAFSSNHFNSAREGLPLIRIRDVNTGFSNTYYSGEYEDRYLVSDGDILIGMDGDFRATRWRHGTSLLNQRVCRLQVFSRTVEPGFLFYLVQGELDRIHGAIQGSTVKHLSSKELERSIIPIPTIEVQAEIVRILDAFTALTAELTAELAAELNARKTQYHHYRNQLFSFNGLDVEGRALGDFRVGAFTRGGGLQKKDLTDHGVPCIHYGQIYTYYGTYAEKTKSYVTEHFASKARKAKPGDLVIATTSENDEDVCKAVAWLGAEDVVVSNDACFFTHQLDPKYVSYFFQTENFQKQKKAYITGTKVRRVNAGDLAKILIPIPFPNDPAKSLAEQQRIANILDKFDTINASLSADLLREIALRKRQYEHYRNLLLSFPKGDQA